MTKVFLPQVSGRTGEPIRTPGGVEHGVEAELDRDTGRMTEMRPAVRFPDGHVEIVQEMAAESQSSNDDVWTQFHEAGFTDLWYAHPGPHPYVHYQRGGPRDRFGPRWHAGVVTGPKHDLVCVRACATREEANRCLSPSGWTPEEAVKLALAKRAELGEKP